MNLRNIKFYAQQLSSLLRANIGYINLGSYILGMLVLLNLGPALIKSKRTRTYSSVSPKSLSVVATMDEAAIFYADKTRNLTSAPECFPTHINTPGGIDVHYLYCSEEAYAKDGKKEKISGPFKATKRLARQYNFWRRVYSLWGEDQYVLHANAYPEVVLEIADASRISEDRDGKWKRDQAKKILNGHKWDYKKILWTMHKHRSTPERFSPSMRRIANMMRHIPEENKYMKAATSLRIQRGQRDQIAQGLSQASKYLEAVNKAFEAEGIPKELSKLAFIESSFNLKAYSKVGAAGVYQIMPATGRQYMRVTNDIDERRDPIKSARAAAKLLKLNHRLTGEWSLAVIAYNHGVGGIRRAVRTVGSSNIEDLIEKYDGPSFGFASKSFYPGFLAVLATIEDSDKIFPDIQKLAPLRYTDIRLNTAMRISSVRETYHVTNAMIRTFNPDISWNLVKHNGWLPRGYTIKIPKHELPPVAMEASPAEDSNSVISATSYEREAE